MKRKSLADMGLAPAKDKVLTRVKIFRVIAGNVYKDFESPPSQEDKEDFIKKFDALYPENGPTPLFIKIFYITKFPPDPTPKRIIPDPIDLGDKTVHFHQDPNVFMTVDFGAKGGKASGTVKGEKASED